ncbi:MAG: TolC family protein [Verrucomicrobia bacterium]|nr:TolC family protein [Verrucomicrobiota bacterium]
MLLLLAGTSVAALAQTNGVEVRKISLEDCIQSALEKNLDMRIARYNPPMALADLQAAYAGYNPNFTIAGAHDYSMSGGGFNPTINTVTAATTSDQNAFNSSLGGLTPWGLNYNLQGNVAESYGSAGPDASFDSSRGSTSINMTQPLLKNFWIDSTRFNIKVGKNRVKYSELGLKQAIMTLVTTVEQAYYDLIYARENVTVQEKAVELAMQLVVENRKRVEVGSLAPLDQKQAEAQAETSRAALIAARSSLVMQENTMKQLISDNYAAMEPVDLQPTAPLSASVQVFDRQISWSRGLTERPDLLQAKLDIERQGITLKYNFNQLFPQLDLVGSYGQGAGGVGIDQFSQALDQMQRGSRPFYSYGAQMTFPVGNTGARATYKRSKLSMEQYVLAIKKLEQTIMITIDNDITQAKSSYQQVAATRAAREYAAEALSAEQKKLENGKSTTYTVLQMQRDLTTARGNEIQALANYNKALAQLSLDEGTALQRLSINVEVK